MWCRNSACAVEEEAKRLIADNSGTRAYRAHTLRRAGCGRLITYRSGVLWREASPLRCKAVLRRASCGLQRQPSAVSRAAQVHRRSLSLGRRRSTLG